MNQLNQKMMRIYKIFLLLFLLQLQLLAAKSIVSVETKIIDKTFPANAQTALQIDNRYGNLNLSTWDKNSIEFHIEIKVDGKNEKEVKERMNAISVDFSNLANVVSAITRINKISNNNRSNMSIQYFVKLPKSTKINIKNTYGNFAIDQLNGRSMIDLKYGNMTVGDLNHTENEINLQYVTSASISSMKTGKLMVSYSNLVLDRSEDIEVKSNYSNLEFKQAKNLLAELRYGNLKTNQIQNITATSKYTNLKINQLLRNLKINAGYGQIMINDVKADFRSIDIESSYSDVVLKMAKNATYQLSADFAYGDLKYPENLTMHKAIKSTNKKEYEGKSGQASGKISLHMRYANARIQ